MISLILPAYNECKSIKRVVIGSIDSLKRLNENFEVIVVDDGSTDNTGGICKKLLKSHKHLRYIRQKHLGKSFALGNGSSVAKGEVIIIMDSDGQFDPKEIKLLINKYNQGFDMVCSYRKNRMLEDSFLKIVPSKIYNFMGRKIFGLDIKDLNCGFKLFKKDIFEVSDFKKGVHRYLPAIAKERGYSIGEVGITLRKRKFGKSHYKVRRFFFGLIDMLSLKLDFIFYESPRRKFGVTGSLMFLSALIITFYFTYLKLSGVNITETNLILLSAMFMLYFMGFQLIFFGLIMGKIKKIDDRLNLK